MKKFFTAALALGVFAAAMAFTVPAVYAHGCGNGHYNGHYNYHEGHGCPYNDSGDCPYYRR